jgi:hypothetical protein
MSTAANELRQQLEALAAANLAAPNASSLEPIERIVSRFEPEVIRAALAERLHDLRGDYGGILLRLVEAVGDEPLLQRLADALEAQPGLAPARMWEALELLQGSPVLTEHPELQAAHDDWAEILEADAEDDGEGLIAELASLLDEDDDPTQMVASLLDGLQHVESEHRAALIASLADRPTSPGLVHLLRLLAHATDPATRASALDALLGLNHESPLVLIAWRKLVAEHPEAAVAARASDALAHYGASKPVEPGLLPAHSDPLADALLTAADGWGLATIALRGRTIDGRYATVALRCDLMGGVVELAGQLDASEGPGLAWFDDLLARPDCDAIAGRPALTVGLLAGLLTLEGARTPLDLPFWLEQTLGRPALAGHPVGLGLLGPDPAGLDAAESRRAAARVLDACPSWADDSDTVYDLAEELLLRHGSGRPDPQRDAGAIRILFEHELCNLIERHRRMLLWMSVFWQTSGSLDLAADTRSLGAQLDEPGQATPGQPYLLELGLRSLFQAQKNLETGIDLRDPATRRQAADSVWP